LRSEIGFAFPQRAGGHLQGDTDRIVGGQPAPILQVAWRPRAFSRH